MYEGFLLITGCAKSRSSTRAEHPTTLDVFFSYRSNKFLILALAQNQTALYWKHCVCGALIDSQQPGKIRHFFLR